MFVYLLLLSRFSRVWLCVTHRRQPTRFPRPWDSPGKNTGVGCYLLLQCMKVKSESEVAQSCLTLSDPMDCSPPGSSVHGIFQARVLEWGAVAFSIVYLLDAFILLLYFVSKCLNCLTDYFLLIGVHACRLSCVQLFVILRTVAHQAPLLMGFFRQEYWSGLSFLLPGDLPNPGIEPASPCIDGQILYH